MRDVTDLAEISYGLNHHTPRRGFGGDSRAKRSTFSPII